MANVSLVGKVCLLVGVTGILGCAAGAADGEETGGTEDVGQRKGEIKGAQSGAAYTEAVLVNMLSGGQVKAVCTGALIAPRVVLTAGHCIRGHSTWEVVSPSLGESALADLGEAYDDLEDGQLVHPASRDVGLLRLVTPLHLPVYPALADKPLAAGKRVIPVGRIRDGEVSFEEVFASKPVRVYDAADIGFPHAYRSVEKIEPGDSGGPSFVFGKSPRVIAAVSSGGGGGVQLLARVDLVRSWILDWTSEHGGEDTGAACAHGVCSTGERLDPACGPCEDTVCAADHYCCDVGWDDQCVAEAASLCGACGA